MKESTKQFYLPHALTRCKRVAIYARVGSSRNSNERALAVQILRCCALVEQHRDWELTCIYVDCGYSGLTAERPGFKCLMLHCCAGRYDMILTFSTYQLSRKTILLLDTLNELDRANVDVFFIQENLCASSSKGKLLHQICAALAVPDPYKEEVNADYSDQSSKGSATSQA